MFLIILSVLPNAISKAAYFVVGVMIITYFGLDLFFLTGKKYYFLD